MSSYIIDSVESLLFETTGQCDLVRRLIMSYMSSEDKLQLREALTQEWRASLPELSDDDHPDVDDDFIPYDPESDWEIDWD